MKVILARELERRIAEKVESGLYANASEVVREGLRLLKDRDQRELRADVRAGFDAADRGEYTEHAATSIRTLASRIKARGRQEIGSAKKSKTR